MRRLYPDFLPFANKMAYKDGYDHTNLPPKLCYTLLTNTMAEHRSSAREQPPG